jgi:hypothetical protein
MKSFLELYYHFRLYLTMVSASDVITDVNTLNYLAAKNVDIGPDYPFCQIEAELKKRIVSEIRDSDIMGTIPGSISDKRTKLDKELKHLNQEENLDLDDLSEWFVTQIVYPVDDEEE